ncbi:MAG: glycosyl transferase family 2, partial [Halobacteriaceae archaeon]
EASPSVPTERAAIILPMTEREYADLATEHLLSELEPINIGQVVVPLRASNDKISSFNEWLTSFNLPLTIIWDKGPCLEALLENYDLDGSIGKGRDIWLAIGVAQSYDYIIFYDADTTSFKIQDIQKLLFPLNHGYEFVKGYYARVEEDGLYGRLNRLFFTPVLSALDTEYDHDFISYLQSFRYPLAGECSMTANQAKNIRLERQWGLEVGILNEVYDIANFEHSAQVDLGYHRHDHRSISGPTGLTEMSERVGDSLFRSLESRGFTIDYSDLRERYQTQAKRLIRQYKMDALFNNLQYSESQEYHQIQEYKKAITEPSANNRLPRWSETALSQSALRSAIQEDLDNVQ